MQCMIIGTPKDSGSPNDFMSVTKKFMSSWLG